MIKIFIGIITAILISGCLTPSPKIIENGTIEATYYETGEIKTKKYLSSKNKRFGWKETYYRTGDLKSDRNRDLAISHEYYRTGGVKSSFERDPNGSDYTEYIFKTYYRTGELNRHSVKRTGMIKSYYKSGKIFQDRNRATKINKIYYENGKLKNHTNNNTNISKNYNKDGKLTSVYLRQNGANIKLNHKDYE